MGIQLETCWWFMWEPNTINLPFGHGSYNPFMVILGWFITSRLNLGLIPGLMMTNDDDWSWSMGINDDSHVGTPGCHKQLPWRGMVSIRMVYIYIYIPPIKIVMTCTWFIVYGSGFTTLMVAKGDGWEWMMTGIHDDEWGFCCQEKLVKPVHIQDPPINSEVGHWIFTNPSHKPAPGGRFVSRTEGQRKNT